MSGGGRLLAWSLALVLALASAFALARSGSNPRRARPPAPTRSKFAPIRAADRAHAELAGSPAAAGRGPGRDALANAVYPAQVLPLTFDHGRHLRAGVGCDSCHAQARTSTRADERLIPTGDTCDRCHGDAHPKPTVADPGAGARVLACADCHTATEPRVGPGAKDAVLAGVVAPAAMLHFDHAQHLALGATCESCHRGPDGTMASVALATIEQLPREADCLACHSDAAGPGAPPATCATCHPSAADGRLQLRRVPDRATPALMPGPASPHGATHDLAFVEDHAGIARARPGLCRECHGEDACAQCHAGPVRPLRIHGGDYLRVHAFDSAARSQDCQSCHRAQSFCLACHERVGLGGARVGPGVTGGSRVHPDGWAGPPGVQRQDHAHAAQRNIAACASCHQEDACLACHATADVGARGLGANPHGPGFTASARCDALVDRNRRVCLKCHAPSDPQLRCG